MKKKVIGFVMLTIIVFSILGCSRLKQVEAQGAKPAPPTLVVKEPAKPNLSSELTVEQIGDNFLAKSYTIVQYTSSYYAEVNSGIASAMYLKQLLKTQKDILEQEKQQTELLKSIEKKTRQ